MPEASKQKESKKPSPNPSPEDLARAIFRRADRELAEKLARA